MSVSVYYRLRQIGIEHEAIHALSDSGIAGFLAVYNMEQKKKTEEENSINDMKSNLSNLIGV